MADYQRYKTPLANMSFTPDVPSSALQPNEYSDGLNVETDVRGIKKIYGEAEILSTISDQVIYMEGGFRTETNWVYIVATRNSSSQGKWFMITSSGISNITPGYGSNPSVFLSGYTADLNITTSWVGGVFYVNDTLNNPIYLLQTASEMVITADALWNYDVGVTKTTAGFIRNYSSPNVGNIMVAGNISKVISGTTYNYPTTVRWSQTFATTGVPSTWEPTINNIANEQEVPVRGPLIDGFMLGANFYVCSYWDTVVFSPIAYQSTSAPVFGVRLLNQGRGLLNNNCWTNTDTNVYGIDSRDVWVFDGTNFKSLGNQRVRNYLYANLNPTYYDRVFMVNNTYKNQIEIYYPDLNSTGYCNRMLSYRYDLDCWNAPKVIANACMGTEGPYWTGTAYNLSKRAVVYAKGGTSGSKLIQTNQGNSFVSGAINSYFVRKNLTMQTKDGYLPYSFKTYIHRLLPEVIGSGNLNITVGVANSTGQDPTYGAANVVPIDTNTPWVTPQQNTGRTISVTVGTNDATDTWNISAINWQATVTEDAF